MGASIAGQSSSTKPTARWLHTKTSIDFAGDLNKLCQALAICPLLARILVSRGLSEPDQVRRFLAPSLAELPSPWLMKDMDVAVTRLGQAIEQRQSILLYGDYDVDGTASVVLLKKAIEILGGKTDFHVPHRLRDGYGMRSDVIEEAAKTGVQLIVSVDTGIRAHPVVIEASNHGIDVIVTDHHLPEAELPPALAVINPHRNDCTYPEKNLCGAGVAFKLVQGLLERSSLSKERIAALEDSFLKLVAIATIADIVPLVGENRVIVKRGLAGLHKVRNPGLRALLGVAGLQGRPSSQEIAFRVAPRINAAGRMASARDVIDLFLTEDDARAKELASQLDVLNRQRQQSEADIVDSIIEECAQTPFDTSCRALVFAQRDWHLGVVGIVASRLVERFSRPVFVLSNSAEEGHYSGSGRSVPSFHLLKALESMPELFKKFGGHRQAAGLTIPESKIEEFRTRFALYAQDTLQEADLCPLFTVDAEVEFAELTDKAVGEVFLLEPFGFGNASPLLCARNVEVASDPCPLGNSKHLSIPLKQNGRYLVMKAWNFGRYQELIQRGMKLDVLFDLGEDRWSQQQGGSFWCATLKDFRTAL